MFDTSDIFLSFLKKNKRTKMKIKSTLAIFAISSLLFTACKKDKAEEPTPSTEQNLTLHIHSNVGAEEANFDSTFETAGGRKFTIADYRMYISNIVLIKNDGSLYPLTGKVLLTDPETEEYSVGKVPVGNYKGFTFQIGLDSLVNHSDPTIYPASSPLSEQTPSIHWSWNSGYIFWKVEGKIDTTIAQNGPVDVDYVFHIGMDDLKRTVDFSTDAFSVVSGTDQIVHLEFDLLDALDGVDLTSELMTHTMDNLPLAVKIADNFPNSFRIE
jgi:hypothetical protein